MVCSHQIPQLYYFQQLKSLLLRWLALHFPLGENRVAYFLSQYVTVNRESEITLSDGSSVDHIQKPVDKLSFTL
jgi:hypothetical protein